METKIDLSHINENTFISLISSFIDSLKKVKDESSDKTSPHNYLTIIGDRDDVVTFFMVYVTGKHQKDTSITIFNKTFVRFKNKPKILTKGKGKWVSKDGDEQCLTQYSNFQTCDYYTDFENGEVDLVSSIIYKPPFTKKGKESHPYQDLNCGYILYVMKQTQSCFIPDLCDYIIEDLKILTPEKIIDIFSSHTIYHYFYVTLLAQSKIGNSIESIRAIFKSTRDNIVFFGNLTTLTKRMFDEFKTEDGNLQSLDFVRYAKMCKNEIKRGVIIESTNSYDIKIHNSHEDVLMDNEFYRKYRSFISLILDKGQEFIFGKIMNSIKSDALEGVVKRLGPLTKMFS